MDRAITVTRLLPAEIDEAFAAWSRADLLAQWFVCNASWTVDVQCDFRIGGAYSFVMREGAHVIGRAHGRYVEIEPPRRIVMTWSSEGSVAVEDSTLSIELAPRGAQTQLTLVHALDPQSAAGRAHAAGWDQTLDVLLHVLAGRARAGHAPTQGRT